MLITGYEDLGGGLKAGFSINTDWNESGGQSQDGTAPTAGQSGFGNSQSYLDLASATMGTLRLGQPNSENLTAVTSVASPAFSTGIGSAYSTNFSIHNGYGTGTTGSNNIFANSSIGNTTSANNAGANVGQRQIRQSNTIKYISPAFSGFNVVLATVRKSDTAGSSTTSGTAGSTDVVGVTEFALNYANGPAAVVFAQTKVSVGANGGLALANNSTTNGTLLTANSSSTMSILGASYQVLPQLKLHAGLGRSSSTGIAVAASTGIANGSSGPADTSSTQFGVTYTLSPAVTLMAQMVKVNDKSAANVDRKMTGVGADYNLSKTARVYFRYDNIDYASNLVAFTGSKQTRTAVGVSKSF